MEELIAKRYVQALLGLTKAEDRDNLATILSNISLSISDDRISEMIKSPIIASDVKVRTILDALGEIDNKLTNFIKILGENGRLALIPAISTIVNAQIQKELNEYSGIIKSKNSLDEESINELEETLKRYTGSTIKLTQESSTLDGLRVEVEDLGIEVNFSKERVKEQLIDFIKKSL